jgi:hypothetical protein
MRNPKHAKAKTLKASIPAGVCGGALSVIPASTSLHVIGGGVETKIGMAGKPINGAPALSLTQATVVKESKSSIRKAVDQIQRWYSFERADG